MGHSKQYDSAYVLFKEYSAFPQRVGEYALAPITIPGDAALADDNAAAEQRAEWAINDL